MSVGLLVGWLVCTEMKKPQAGSVVSNRFWLRTRGFSNVVTLDTQQWKKESVDSLFFVLMAYH